MQPDETARYEGLQKEVYNLSISIGELTDLIKSNQTLLTKNQANNIKKLYISTVSNELNEIIIHKLRDNNVSKSRDQLIKDIGAEIQKIMSDYASFLDDLIEMERYTLQAEIAKQIHGKDSSLASLFFLDVFLERTSNPEQRTSLYLRWFHYPRERLESSL
ncbi:MAG TPA: hypothetical protein ENN79_03205 [Desulfobacteraceae bacterium]|nr:hypothetical protein [Desulfobacteraceae bacterium]